MAMALGGASGAVVLGYHDVVASLDGATPFTVSARQLRQHVVSLRRAGYRIVAMSELVAALEAGRSVDRLAVVTFDDGLVGVHEHALGVLSELGAPATAFVVSAAPRGEPPAFWPEARRTMTTDELLECDAGGITIASHTRTHRSLVELPLADLRDELSGSRADLEELTGHAVETVAYPSGHHDGRVRAAALAAGYRAGFTFVNGRVRPSDDRFGLARFCMTARHGRLRFARHLRRAAEAWHVPADVRAA